MSKDKNKETKTQDQEKSVKNLKKSSYSKKKRKVKKNILNGIAYVQSTFNNTIISIADTSGNKKLNGFEVKSKNKKNPEIIIC